MLKIIRRRTTAQGNVPVPEVDSTVTTPVQAHTDEEIPRYPPFMKGLPVSNPDKLIATQQELVGQIREAGLASKEMFEQYYLEALRRFAAFVHLLPASQSHHHRGAGGLFRHSTEVALWSLQSGDRVLLPGDHTPRRRRELEPRWHLAVFLAALCHDVGKPVTDLAVTSRNGEQLWNPFIEDLYSWAVRHGVDRYFLHWKENRGKKHTTVGSLIAGRIISQKELAWIGQGNTDLVVWMMEAINGQPSQDNLIHDLVVRSDQVSAERDLSTLGEAFAGYELGLPVERMLIDIMRRLFREGHWSINEPGSRLWHMAGALYLVWPSGGEEIAAIINQDKLPGLPRTPNSILDMLVDRKLAFVRDSGMDGHRCWQIAPDPLIEKLPNCRLSAIRLRDTSLIIDVQPPFVSGKVIEEMTDSHVQIADKTSIAEKRIAKSPAARSIGSESPEQQVSDATSPAAHQLDGPVGTALMALAEHVRTDQTARSKMIHMDAAGALWMKWPDAFQGRGLENKVILDELGRRGWLVLDPLAPFRKVSEVDTGQGAPWKAIQLQPFVKVLMGLASPENDRKKSPETESARKHPKPTAPAPQNDMPVEKKSASVEGKAQRQLALIEKIVTTLRRAVKEDALPAQEENGFLWIKVKDAEAVLKDKINVTRGQAFVLNGIAPTVFASVDRKPLQYFRIRA